ncbi:MAG: tryptophan--tRNA ligase [Conchiformibius sp.]|nr:tryptophan--tRNA ligase [Conchiformibius sp.]
MTVQRVLTGITTTGTPHLGNYVGAIRPAIRAAHNPSVQSYLFLADYHGIIKCRDPEQIHESTRAIAATWLACGLDPERTVFYRQSDIHEILELNWVLSCMTAKGLMNRAHAYKDAVAKNLAADNDADYQVDMGLYSYPVLMTADILMFNANRVPVGRDQIQHIEMAQDVAQRFNHHYGETFVLPQAEVDDNVQLLVGLDGRKMSKSYGNTIPLFQTPKQRQKTVNKILTNMKEPGEPKGTDESPLFAIYQAFATPAETAAFAEALAQGLAWGEAKKLLSAKIGEELDPFTERYEHLLAHPHEIEEILQAGAAKARREAGELIGRVREAVGIRKLG